MLISLVVLFLSFMYPGNAKFCNDTLKRCCPNYLLVDGACRPCYGSWGINCTKPCKENFYGYGCSSTCVCGDDQICHSKVGCINIYDVHPFPYSGVIIGGVVGSSCLIVIFIIIYKRKTTRCNRSCSENNMGYQRKTENVQNDVRSPRAEKERSVHLSFNGSSVNVLSLQHGEPTSSNRKCESNWKTSKQEITESSCESCSGQTQNKSQNVSTRPMIPVAQSVRRYGKCQEFQDTYDHLSSTPNTASVHSEQQPLYILPRRNLVRFTSDKSNADDGYVSFDGSVRRLPLEKSHTEKDSRPYSSVNFDR